MHVWRLAVTARRTERTAASIAGIVSARQVRAGSVSPPRSVCRRLASRDLARRFWLAGRRPAAAAVLDDHDRSWITSRSAVVAAVDRAVGRARRRSPELGRLGGLLLVRRHRLAAVPVVALTSTSRIRGVVDEWGGIMLNLFLACARSSLCFPLGVLLALGRRSQLPLIRVLSGATSSSSAACRCSCCCCSRHRPRVLPPRRIDAARPRRPGDRRVHPLHRRLHGRDRPRRTAVGAARAERGRPGARACRRCAIDVPDRAAAGAAQRDPALVGQFISLFKDTTLAGAAMGLFELLDGGRGRSPRSRSSGARA